MQDQQRELDRARNAERNLRRKEERMRNFILDVCFILFVWCAPSGSLALAYAAHATSTKKHDAEVRIEQLQRRYLETDLDTLSAINTKDAGMSKRAFAEADRFQSQFDLFQWIETQNDAKGVAPNTTMVRNHVVRKSMEPTGNASPTGALVAKSVSVSWVQRFRKRWALKRGRFMPGERLPRDVIGDKVAFPLSKTIPTSVHLSLTLCFRAGQKRGPLFGPQTRTV